MAKKLKLRDVVVLGVGLHPFGRFPPEKTYMDLAKEAISRAIEDAGIKWRDVQVAMYSHVREQASSAGLLVFQEFGSHGIPMIGNIENACSSSSTAVWLATRLIGTGLYDIILVAGAEKMPRGPLTSPLRYSPERYLGTGVMMGLYAFMARRYMREYGAPIEAIAQVSVKNHRNGAINPYAQYKKVFTLEEVLNSRMIADPLTLYQCCPTSDGAAALVLCAADVASKYTSKPLVRIAGSALHIQKYSDRKKCIPQNTVRAAEEAYEQAGISPKDVRLAEVHDAATIGEIVQIEALGLCPEGEGWKYTIEGKTEINGVIPVNPSGGLQAQGHPLGATGARQIAEITLHLRGEAGERQVPGNPKVGVTECAGFGGVSTVHVLVRQD